MPKKFRNAFEENLSSHLLQWLEERVPADDPIRIPNLDNYQFIENLGNGRFGEVCKYMKSMAIYETVKKVKLEIFDHWTQDSRKLSNRLDNFIAEFRHLHKVSNNNDRIVNFIGIYSDLKNLYIMTEYLPRGSVKSKIMEDTINEDTAVRYLTETLEAVNYLHSMNPPVVHRDIKAANLLITISDSIKLGNFGLVRDLAVDGFGMAVASEIALDFRGTLLYVAPEVLSSTLGPGNRNAYDCPADIWALGCTFIEMLLKYPPHFEYFGHVDKIHEVLLGYAREENGNELPYTADVLVPTSSKCVQSIVDAIFVKSPGQRPSAKKLKSIISHICEKREIDSDDEESLIAGTSSTGEDLPPVQRKIGNAGSSSPIETIENEHDNRATKQITPEGSLTTNGNTTSQVLLFFGYYSTRIIYFLGILTKSVGYLLFFLTLGIGALCAFLFLSYFIVQSVRYFIALYCQCDLNQPQYLVISGILIVLLFALLFSCCMVALGEYKFRMANRSLRESRFFISRPQKSAKFCGIPVLPGKESARKAAETLVDIEEPIEIENNLIRNHDDYYYNTP